jgi:hypothetical protein
MTIAGPLKASEAGAKRAPFLSWLCFGLLGTSAVALVS